MTKLLAEAGQHHSLKTKRITSAAHRDNVNVLLSNSTFLIFAF